MSLIPIFKDTFFVLFGNNNKGICYSKRREIIKKFCKKIILGLLVFVTLILVLDTKIIFAAGEVEVIPGGETIGLKLNTGIYVAGKYEVDTKNGKKAPWRKSDIEVGDKIIEIDNKKVVSNEEMAKIVNNSMDNELVLTIIRGSEEFDTSIEIIETKQKERSLGLYIKDKLVGVGTLTFINPKTKAFASLGHGIVDQKVLIGSISGDLLVSNIDSIKKALPGEPGEKRATISNNILGKLTINNATGIYGYISSRAMLTKKTIKVGKQEEVKLGKASILTVLDDDKVQEYDIEIIEINRQNTRNVKGLKIKVTDSRLIEKCGGIVQGMSGSPIIQNNKIIGAVSHVTVDDPLIGYGIHIEWMLNDSK